MKFLINYSVRKIFKHEIEAYGKLYLNASLHVFDPSRGSLQPVGGHNVISKEPVEYPDNPQRWDVLREKLSVAL